MNQIFFMIIVSGMLSSISVAWSATHVDDRHSATTMTSTRSVASTDWIQLAGILPQDGEAMYEIEFWNSIKDSKNSADFEAYLEAYPKGRFAPLAKVRAERYRKKSAPVNQPLEPTFKVEEISDRYDVVTSTNVRKEPSASSDKIGELRQGSSIKVTGRVQDRNWYRIDNPKGGVGYVYAPLLKKPSPPAIAKPKPVKPKPKPKPVKQVTQTITSPQPASTNRISTAGDLFKDCPNCPDMVSITPGRFTMGDNKGDRSERPAHQVTLSKPFAIGKYEVTVAQWNECVKAGACNPVSDTITTSDNAPIRDVSWDDAQEYLAWLSKLTGENYRLPTEAEWEYAARAGTTTTYWWGNRIIQGKANCKDCGNPWNRKLPAKVGSFDANPHGLHDMNGNVWEWVNDCWHKNYKGAPKDGSTWSGNNCTVRVIRGGSWRNDKTYVHSASRFKYDAYVRYLLNGFRVAKSLK